MKMGRGKAKKLFYLLLGLNICAGIVYYTGMSTLKVSTRRVSSPKEESSHATQGAAAPIQSTQLDRMQIYISRRQTSDDACFLSKREEVKRMVEHNETNVAYCVIPKVGCTYWLSVFRWLHKDTLGREYTSPFDMPRYQVHYRPHHMKYHRFSASAHKGPSYLSGRLRFMFVREPYSRLWSAYVDKFLLPDYWNVDGVRITRRRPGVSREAAKCGHDVTFAEFVDYVTSVPASKLNDHYGPYHLLCSPCLFLPHVIGKMETFDQDAKYILDRMNLTGLDAQLQNRDQRAEHEMDMLIDDAFHEIRYQFFRGCTNTTHIAARLWQVFQINGYVPASMEFPWAQSLNVDRLQLKALVKRRYEERRPTDRAFWQAQKERAMVDAYSSLSESAMSKLRGLYALDFAMFGYDPTPEILYRRRRRGS